MTTSHLLDMLQLSKMRVYEADEVITSEGVFDSWLYILVSGEVAITKASTELARMSRNGDTFGELAVLDGQARSATVTATVHTKCLAIDASFMDSLPPDEQSTFYSVFYRVVAEILSKRLRDTDKELADCRAALTKYQGQSK